MVGMVPDMFQVPIRAPTPNKIKNGVETEASADPLDLEISSHVCPFLRRIRATTMVLKINATCMGPSAADTTSTAPSIWAAPVIMFLM